MFWFGQSLNDSSGLCQGEDSTFPGVTQTFVDGG